jgi:hypothetical protein
MTRKSLLILTSSVLVLGALLIGAYTSGVMRFGRSSDGDANMSMQGDFGGSGAGIESIYGSLTNALGNSSGGYQAVMRADHIVLIDAASGSELGTIRKIADNQINLSGIVGNVGPVSGDIREKVMSRINEFNDRSGLGTLKLQEATGDVVLEHKVDPQRTSADDIAKLAVKFSEKARQQTALFATFKQASNS